MVIREIRNGRLELGVYLFESEPLQWPGFIEFDHMNKKVLTFSASRSLYKVWSLSDYRLLYQLRDRTIDEIKLSPGVILLIHTRDKQRQPLHIIDVESGETLQHFTHTLRKNQNVVCIEQFNEKLLVKQKRVPLQLVDVATHHSCVELSEAEFPAFDGFVFLYQVSRFLTLRKREINVWNLNGQRVASFDDHYNFYADCNTNNLFISQEQDVIISYCLTQSQIGALKNRHLNPDAWNMAKKRSGCISISHIFSGKSIAKIERLRTKKYPLRLLSPVQQYHALLAKLARVASDIQRQQQHVNESALPTTVADSDVSPLGTMSRTANLHTQTRAYERQLAITRQSIRVLETHTGVDVLPAPSDSLDTNASVDLPIECDDDRDILDDELNDDLNDELDAVNHLDLGEETDMDAHEPDMAMTDFVPLHAISFRSVVSEGMGARTVTPNISTTEHSCSYSSDAPSPQTQLSPKIKCEWPLRTLDDYRSFNRHAYQHNQALRDITVVFYNEKTHELYTGNKAGFLHVWAQ